MQREYAVAQFSDLTHGIQGAVTVPRITTVQYPNSETCSAVAVLVVSAEIVWPERGPGPEYVARLLGVLGQVQTATGGVCWRQGRFAPGPREADLSSST